MKKHYKKYMALVMILSVVITSTLSGCVSADAGKTIDRIIERVDAFFTDIGLLADNLLEGKDSPIGRKSQEEKETTAEAETEKESTEETEAEQEKDGESEKEEKSEKEEREYIVSEKTYTDFKEFTDDVFTDLMSSSGAMTTHFFLRNPEEYGVEYEEDSLWPDMSYSEEDSAGYYEYIRELLETLRQFNKEELDEEGQLMYDDLEWFCETELEGEGLDLYYEPLSSSGGEHSMIPTYFVVYTLSSEEDVQTYLRLMEGIPEYFESIISYENTKRDEGLFMNDYQLQQVIDQCNEFLETEENSFVEASFKESLSALGLDSEKENGYLEEFDSALHEDLYEAYRYLVSELEPMKGSGLYEGGLRNFPEGREYYNYKIRSMTGTDMTAQEMVKAVEAGIQTAFESITSVYYSDPTIFYQSVEYPSTDPNLCMRILIEKSKVDFPELDSVDYEIRYVDSSLRDYLAPAMYFTPPYDSDTSNIIMINCEKGQESSDIFTTICHEGYPGHMYQTNYFKEHSTYPLRYVLSTSGFTEGYAEYVEIMSYKYLDGSSSLSEYMCSTEALTLLVEARCDLGVNAEGWTLEETLQYASDYFDFSDESGQEFYEYLVGDPGGYMDYAIGMLEIQDLKSRAVQEEGWSTYDFHQRLLDLSGAPFSVIEEYMFE